jgi:hypothetical protein
LGNAVEFALNGCGEGGEPLVLDDECLDLLLGEARIFFVGELVERGVGVADGALEFGFLGVELQPLLEDSGFVGLCGVICERTARDPSLPSA